MIGRRSREETREGRGRDIRRRQEAGELAKLRREPYYHGPLPRETVESILHGEGEFLLRLNEKSKARWFVLDVRWAGVVRHFRINSNDTGTAYFIRKDKPFPSVKEAVDHHWKTDTPLVDKDRESGPDGNIRLQSPAPKSRWELNRNDVQLGQPIGRGAFGEVYRGRYLGPSPGDKERSKDKSTEQGTEASSRFKKRISRVRSKDNHKGVDVAVKLCKVTSPDGRAMFEQEAMFALRFKHKNIIEAIGVVLSDNVRMIVLEYMPNGSLQSFLKRERARHTQASLKGFCLDAGRGMEYLERLHCIHRDVATRNCLVGAREEVKISDFGLAKGQAAYKMVSSSFCSSDS